MPKAKVRAYMHQEVEELTDFYTGEINATALAEDAANFFNIYGPPPSYDIPDWVFEYAADIADKHETNA